MLYKILIFIFLLSSNLNAFASWTLDIEGNIIPDSDSIYNVWSWEWLSAFDTIIIFVKDSIFWLLMVISVGVFLYIWARLALARWNPEEFKKALQAFIYSIVWLMVVFLSWALVKLVVWIDIN